MQAETENITSKALKALSKEYVAVGKTRVRSWHAWLVIGVAVGIFAGVLFVANRSGEFEEGSASGTDSSFRAVFLGITGEDKIGAGNEPPNGNPDLHISVSGLRAIPSKVTITSDLGGVWAWPYDGRNWAIASPQYDGKGNGDFWFEPFTANRFHVQVVYRDGTTHEADAARTP